MSTARIVNGIKTVNVDNILVYGKNQSDLLSKLNGYILLGEHKNWTEITLNRDKPAHFYITNPLLMGKDSKKFYIPIDSKAVREIIICPEDAVDLQEELALIKEKYPGV